MRFVNINHEKKYIFLHPNRNGGKSIEKVLFERDPSNGTADHQTAAAWVKHLNGVEVWNQYYKFGFLRNPWERIASIYLYRLNNNGKVDNYRKASTKFFQKFIEGRTANGVRSIEADRVPQYDYFHYKDKPINFIGKIQTYSEDFEELKRQLKLDSNLILPHLNKSNSSGNWKELYNNTNIELVYKLYEKDINTWGFSFDTGPTKNYWNA